MHLKELEIFGFKSFPEKTTLKFEPGITVVVGPNGCGKSNVLDAIKWALGEQSPKSLRGSKMEDIIFNGTEHFAPLNYADVIMTFSNEDHYLPIEYKEVSVGRRLYRSGESQYFINKNPVRLKDVQDLFMGTGIGESTYSFVEQGKIEIFLGYKPEEKRLIFDEASGIVKYKDRKKETMRRLEETDENLLRLDDIISEVARQIRYLERQVEKARKYKEIEENLVGVEKKIATLQFMGLQEKHNNFDEELKTLNASLQDKDLELLQVKKIVQEMGIQASQVRKSLEEMNMKVVSLIAQKESAISQIAVCEQRINELGERNLAISTMKDNVTQRLTLQDSRLSEAQHELDLFSTRVQEIVDSIDGFKAKKEELLKLTDGAKKKINSAKIQIMELETSRANTHNALIEVQTQVASLIKRKQRLLLDKAKVEGFLRDSAANLESTKLEFTKIEQSLTELKVHTEALSGQEKDLVTQREALKNKLVDREKEFLELNTCYEFLKDLRLKYDTLSLNKKVTIIFDEEPKDINKLIVSLKGVSFNRDGAGYRASIEAKVVSLEENEIEKRMQNVQQEISGLKEQLVTLETQKETYALQLRDQMRDLEEKQRLYHEKMQEKETLSKDWQRVSEEHQILTRDIETVLSEISN